MGNFDAAIGFWQELFTHHPIQSEQTVAQINAIRYHEYFNFLENPSRLSGGKTPKAIPEEYIAEANLRDGAIQLMLNRNIDVAEEKLRSARAQLPKNAIPNIFLLLCKIAKREDPSLDKTFFEQTQKIYGDASTYLLFRGLWLATSKPEIAIHYIEKAKQVGIENHLPHNAITSIQYILTKLIDKTKPCEVPFSNYDHKQSNVDIAPFLSAIGPLLAYTKLELNQEDLISWFEHPLTYNLWTATSWKETQAVYFAIRKNWIEAISAIQGKALPELEQRLIVDGIHNSIRKKDWQLTAELVSHALKKDPGQKTYQEMASKLQGALLQKSWREKDYETHKKLLHKHLGSEPGNAHIHHNLALMFTNWAVNKDLSRSSSNNKQIWRCAIGHWAVVLSDKRYWIQWQKQRNQGFDCGPIIDSGDETTVIDELIYERIPDTLKAYFSEREGKVGDEQASFYRYCTALLEQEMEYVTAIRRLISQAKRQNGNLPPEIVNWISPLLVVQNSGNHVKEILIKDLSRYKLSLQDARLIRIAFSELREAQTLSNSGQCDEALKFIQQQENDHQLAVNQLDDLQHEKVIVLEKYALDLIKSAKWDLAVQKAHEAVKLKPAQDNLKNLYIDACLGWANQRLRDDDYENTVQFLKSVVNYIQKPNSEIKALLSQALALWGAEALEQGEMTTGQKRLEESLQWDQSNPDARNGMFSIFIRLAAEAEQRGDVGGEYENCQRMYQYVQSPETATFLARASAKLALKFSEMNQYQTAIQILTPAMDLPYYRSEFQLEPLMSAILTDQGAALYNSGQYSAGIQAMQLALKIDPTNDSARQNLSIAGRRW